MPNETCEKVGFLEEAPGERSSMRLMCFIALVGAIVFGFMELQAKVPFPNITTMFLVAAFAPKAVQKFAERGT